MKHKRIYYKKPEDVFKRMQSIIKRNRCKFKKEINGLIEFRIDQSKCKIDLCECRKRKNGKADSTIKMHRQDFLNLCNKRMTPIRAILEGRITILGDYEKIIDLGIMFDC